MLAKAIADYCRVIVNVTNNVGAGCANSGDIDVAGAIAMENGNGVADVADVILAGAGSASAITRTNGDYQFTNLVAGSDYTITPVKDYGYTNGVSTYDLVLISAHPEHEPLTSQYQQVAADVTNDGNISVADLVSLRKLILGIDSEFTNNTSGDSSTLLCQK